ncbi:MAG: PDZ domain-containing protein, partial [Acidimicrobiia bacterium]|nr:PDZ domain-containing protein [Acidimicrobiia bacterium]
VPAGARVFAFTPESPLKARGAQIGDVILAVDGEPVHTMDQLVTMLLKRRASETANLVVMRNGVETPISIQFGSQP